MGYRKIGAEAKREAVAEVLRGGAVREVARGHGVSESALRSWVASARAEAERRRREAAERALRGAQGPSPHVRLLVLSTPRGDVLAVANVGRDGRPTGTVQRVAGAHVGTGAPVRAAVARTWVADARVLLSAARSAVEAGERR